MPQPKTNPNPKILDIQAKQTTLKWARDMLKSGVGPAGKPLGFKDKNWLKGLIKGISNPQNGALSISKIISSIGTAAGGLAVNIGEIISGTVLPREQTKREESANKRAVEEARIAANQAIQTQAIAAGVWNSGVSGNPNNNANQQKGNEGDTPSSKTPGSFLDNW